MIKKRTYIYEPYTTDIKQYQLELWQNYLGLTISIDTRFKNPLRTDNNPGAILREKNGYIRLFDPPSRFHSMTIFQLITEITGIKSFEECAAYAYYEILKGKIIERPKKQVVKKKPCQIRTEFRNWNLTDKKFWNGKTNITKEQLEFENHYPVKKFSFTAKGYWNTIIPKLETYVDIIKEKKKIYCPAKRFWITNFGIESIGGNKEFKSKTLYITKNAKSYMILCNMGFDTRYVINEGSKLPIAKIKEWDNYFDKIYLLFDDDLGGLVASQNLQKQWKLVTGNEIYAIFLPKLLKEYTNPWGIKKQVVDTYDYTKFYDINYTYKLINEISRKL